MKNKTKILLGTLSTSLFIPFVAASCTNNDKTNVSTPENVSANPSTPVQKDPGNVTNPTNENNPTNPVDQNPSSEPKTPSKNNEMTQEEFDAYAENIFNNVLKVKKLTDEEKEKVIKTFAGGEWHNEKYGNQLSVSNGKNGITLINTVLKNNKIKNAKVSIAEINDKEFSKNQFSLASPNKLNENKEKGLQFLEVNYDSNSKTLSFSFKIYNRTTKLKSSKDYSLSFDLNVTSVNGNSEHPTDITDNKNTNGTVSEGSQKDNENDTVVNPSSSVNTDNTNNNQPNPSADNNTNTVSPSNPSDSSSDTSSGNGSVSSNDSTSPTAPSVTDGNPSGDNSTNTVSPSNPSDSSSGNGIASSNDSTSSTSTSVTDGNPSGENSRNTDSSSSSNPSDSSSGTSDGSGSASSSDTNTSANDTESPTVNPGSSTTENDVLENAFVTYNDANFSNTFADADSKNKWKQHLNSEDYKDIKLQFYKDDVIGLETNGVKKYNKVFKLKENVQKSNFVEGNAKTFSVKIKINTENKTVSLKYVVNEKEYTQDFTFTE